VKKENEGPNAWCQTSKFSRDQLSIDDARTSEGTTLASEWGDDTEQMVEFHILFGKEVKIGQTFSFSFKFSQPLEITRLSKIPFLSATSLIIIPKAFGTQCNSFIWGIKCPDKSQILHCLQPWQVNSPNMISLSTKLRPHEFVPAAFVLHEGPLSDKSARIVIGTGTALLSGLIGRVFSLI